MTNAELSEKWFGVGGGHGFLPRCTRRKRLLFASFTGSSSLYRDEKSGTIYLLLKMRDMEEVAAMQRVIASLSEYGTPEKVSPARQQYLVTHCSVLCVENALGTLAQL